MREHEWAELPARPPGIAEWEATLLRLELAPRALRVALEVAPDGPAAVPVLREAVRTERRLAAALQAMAAQQQEIAVAAEPIPLDEDAGAMLAEFERLRARNFAAMQRRGIGVWEWAVRMPGANTAVTTYQLLGATLRGDARTLATLRALPRAAGPC
jgi:hypothetical protein